MSVNHVVSFSGGKDSTAMLLVMLERGEPIHSVVFFDTGWEFPQMYEHIDKVEDYTGIKIVKLRPKRPFKYWLLERPIVGRQGKNKGRLYRIGSGWPSPMRRWCTREKVNALRQYQAKVPEAVDCIGIALDEAHRTAKRSLSKSGKRFPLIEWGITEKEALQYCYRHGFSWGGLYKIFNRVSCFCCPLQRMAELRKLRSYFPDLWAKMLEWDKQIKPNIGFKGYKTVHDLERMFAQEPRRKLLWEEP